METLILPSLKTKVIRRAASDLSGPGRWHVAKENRERVTRCNDFISHLYKIDIATLDQVQAVDLCSSCRRATAAADGSNKPL